MDKTSKKVTKKKEETKNYTPTFIQRANSREPEPQDMEERPSPSVELLTNAMKLVFDKTDIALKTELNDEQIRIYTLCEAFGDLYDLDLLNTLVDGYMQKSVSRHRKGRKEFAELASASFRSISPMQEDVRPSIPDRLLGRAK